MGTVPNPNPPGGPPPPGRPPINPPVPCVVAPPPPVSDDPIVAQEQARIWRGNVIEQEATIADLVRQLADHTAQSSLGEAVDRLQSECNRLTPFEGLCERAAQMIRPDTRNPQEEKWWEDYQATKE